MGTSLKKALKYFKYLSIVFLLGYCIYVVVDDFIFIKQITGLADFTNFIGRELIWLLVYYLGFSFYFWLITFTVIFIYLKMYKPLKVDSTQ